MNTYHRIQKVQETRRLTIDTTVSIHAYGEWCGKIKQKDAFRSIMFWIIPQVLGSRDLKKLGVISYGGICHHQNEHCTTYVLKRMGDLNFYRTTKFTEKRDWTFQTNGKTNIEKNGRILEVKSSLQFKWDYVHYKRIPYRNSHKPFHTFLTKLNYNFISVRLQPLNRPNSALTRSWEKCQVLLQSHHFRIGLIIQINSQFPFII